ncbi:MAG: DMT family transporter [Chloroflexi bacterium]|nr:DMT family transporter [Chloroflexota bacterium]
MSEHRLGSYNGEGASSNDFELAKAAGELMTVSSDSSYYKGKGWQRLGYAAVVMSALGYGTSWVFMKWLYGSGLEPMQLLSNRYLFATPVMWLILLAATRGRPRLARKDIAPLFAVGLINAGTEIALAFALVRLDASLVSVLFYTYPVIVSGMAVVLFSESLNRFRVMALSFIVAGTILVAQLNPFQPMQLSGLGVILALTAALACAIFSLSTQSLGATSGPLEMTTLTVSFAAVSLIIMKPPTYLFDGSVNPDMWPAIVALSILCTAVPLSCFVVGVSMIGASNTSIAATLEPVVAVVSAFIVLGERLVPLQILGVIAILAAVTVLQFQPEVRAKPAAGNPDAIGPPA